MSPDIEARIRQLVAQAPALTDEQRVRLAGLLRTEADDSLPAVS